MDKIKRFFDCAVPELSCNFKCHYCYIGQEKGFVKAPPVFKYSPKKICDALTKERMGGICLFNLCAGGETLIPDEIIPIIKGLLENGHYVSVVTNGSISKRFTQIAQFKESLLKRLFFKFSFQYFELKRLNLMDSFFKNINLVKEKGCSFTVELTPCDEFIPYIDDIKKLCLENVGSVCHVTVARNETDASLPILSEMTKEEYNKTWGSFDSSLFDFKMKLWDVKRKEFCYAGDWTNYLNLGTGILRQCYCGCIIQNIFKDINKPIKFQAVGNNCKEPHCHNGHSWLSLGAIPSLDTPTYAELRNKQCVDGSEWLVDPVKSFFSSKLSESSTEYSEEKKKKTNKYIKGKISRMQFLLKGIRLVRKIVPTSWKISHAKNVVKRNKKEKNI